MSIICSVENRDDGDVDDDYSQVAVASARVYTGYTLTLWVNFTHVASRQPYVYMSNGGHSESSHGVAMIYDGGNLEMRFRDRDGREWTAGSDNVLPTRWTTWPPRGTSPTACRCTSTATWCIAISCLGLGLALEQLDRMSS